MSTEYLECVGFWARVGAACIDILVQLAITEPLTYAIYGRYTSSGFNFMGPADLLINFVLPAIAVIALWMRFGATPGKIALSARIVDADTGETLTAGMSLIRYLGYFVGFIWIGFDRRKQGWHDKLANSVVIRPAGTASVRFTAKEKWREDSGGSVASDPTLQPQQNRGRVPQR